MNKTTELMMREPRDWMRRMMREFDRFFEEPRLPFFATRRRELDESTWMPDIEVFERDNRLIARLDLPGLKKDDISVEAREGALTISGERKRETEQKDADWFRSELVYGRFCRVIPLPEGIKPVDVAATFTNGVLEVRIPLPLAAAAPPARKVPIDEPKEIKAKTAA
jgi:HSP20 family protein